MKGSIFSSKFIIFIGLILIAISLAYLSTDQDYEVKEITKKVKLINIVK
jgi:hypothetical protein